MKTTALIEKGKDGKYGVYTPEIDTTIIGEGDTVAEAKADFENSVSEVFAAYKETGRTMPDELNDISFEYKYDVSSVFNFFEFLNISAFAKRAKINPSLMRQYCVGKTYISELQKKKIEKALHECGQELLSVSL